jgi:hypothetical protein
MIENEDNWNFKLCRDNASSESWKEILEWQLEKTGQIMKVLRDFGRMKNCNSP